MTCTNQMCQVQDRIHPLLGAASSAHLLFKLRNMPGAMMYSMLQAEKKPINGRPDALGALPAKPELSTCLASKNNKAINASVHVDKEAFLAAQSLEMG